jgi:hypothetical protein
MLFCNTYPLSIETLLGYNPEILFNALSLSNKQDNFIMLFSGLCLFPLGICQLNFINIYSAKMLHITFRKPTCMKHIHTRIPPLVG